MMDRLLACLAEVGHGGVGRADLVCLDNGFGVVDRWCFLVFAGGPEPVAVAKASRSPVGRAVQRVEHDNLLTLAAAGVNREYPRAPAPLGRWHDGELQLTLQTALPGASLRSLGCARLLGPERCAATVDAVLDWWATTVERVGVERRTVDEALYTTLVLEPLALFLALYQVSAAERALLEERLGQRRALLGLTLPLMVRHQDLFPANLLWHEGRVGAVDWEFRLAPALPLFDLFYFFAATRFPYSRWGRESRHSISMRQVFWGANRMNGEWRRALAVAGERFGVVRAALPDLFLMALVTVALSRYQGAMDRLGQRPATSAAAVPADQRRLLAELELDEVMIALRGGRCQALSWLAADGFPPALAAA